MPESLIVQLKSPGVKCATSRIDHMSWHKPSHRTDPAPLTSFFFYFIFFRRVWRETRPELMCLDISLHLLCHRSRGFQKASNFQSVDTGDDTEYHITCFNKGSNPRAVIGLKFMSIWVTENSIYFIERKGNGYKSNTSQRRCIQRNLQYTASHKELPLSLKQRLKQDIFLQFAVSVLEISHPVPDQAACSVFFQL